MENKLGFEGECEIGARVRKQRRQEVEDKKGCVEKLGNGRY